jgi:hypothetical protein
MNGNISKDQVKDESFLYAKFAEPGSTIFGLEMSNILPGQLLSLSGTLEVIAKAQIMEDQSRQREERAKNSLTVPKSEIEIAK